MTVENPHTWVIGNESNHHVAHGIHVSRITTHGNDWKLGILLGVEGNGTIFVRGLRSRNNLEVVTMHVEWMRSWIVIVDNNLDSLHMLKNKRMSEFAINTGIAQKLFRCRQDSVKGRNLGRGKSDVVEKA